MLIKVFGIWLNPDNITFVTSNMIIKNDSTVGLTYGSIDFPGHTPDEVAAEIKRLVAEKGS